MRRLLLAVWLVLAVALPFAGAQASGEPPRYTAQSPNQEPCQGEFISVSPALNDLGENEYIRMSGGPEEVLGGPTGFIGGLYPGGSNVRPPEHTAAGLWMASQVVPRDASGVPDPDGRIVLLGIGMSNVAGEFQDFRRLAEVDPDVNPGLTIINAAQGGKVASYWVDPQDSAWDYVDEMLAYRGVTEPQVQAVYIKEANFYLNEFPEAQYMLQADLESILTLLKGKFPNLKLAYLSSRIRSFAYWVPGGPEPGAFETAFAVRWLLEKQINGDPSLNFDERLGTAPVPWASWGPYMWADGLNPRSDGLIWVQTDLNRDCVHPSYDGRAKVAAMLLDFFKTDPTTITWFLASPEPVDPLPVKMYIPNIHNGALFTPYTFPVYRPDSPHRMR